MNELIERIHLKSGADRVVVSLIISAMSDAVVDMLKAGKEPKIPTFGRFYLTRLNEKKVRMPLTGEVKTIPPRTKITFRLKNSLRIIELPLEYSDKSGNAIVDSGDDDETD